MIKQYNLKYKAVENEVIKKVNQYFEKVDSFPGSNPIKQDITDINKELSKLIETYFTKAFEKFLKIKEQLSDIKRETKFENFTKYMDLLLENDNRIMNLIEKGNQKTTLEKLEPLLPAALIAVNTIISNRSQNKNSKELLKEIKALIVSVDEDGKKEQKKTIETQKYIEKSEIRE